MRLSRPVEMILIGLVLVLLGAVLPFLMVMQVLQSTFLLNFFSYGASIVGLFLGLLGSASLVQQGRGRRDKK
jgi:hypothetical protein